MERKRANLGPEYQKRKEIAVREGGLCGDLWNYAASYYSTGYFDDLWNRLTKIYGKAPNELKTPEEFWHPKLEEAIVKLAGKEFLMDLKEIVSMRMTGQFSNSMWRRSFRSSDFGYHASWTMMEIAACLYASSHEQNVKELLYCEHDWIRGYDALLALELRRNQKEIVDIIREAILGDNQQVLLTRIMIRAIIISGHEELLTLLLKLLVAARLQEGLRQQILENADAGSVETLTRIIKLCLDEDMFRYSSVTRAFDVWTGLGYGDAKPAVVKKCAAFAYDCLVSKETRKQYLTSENNLESYFALWATGCYEIAETDQMVRKLLDDEKKYRRILGWLFTSHVENSGYRMNVACHYLEERDEETLAYIVNNLASTQQLLYTYGWQRKENAGKPIQNSSFPKDAKSRKEIFEKLKQVAEFIGNKNRTFRGNPFAFTEITLHNEPVINCMLSLAGYDMDEGMIKELKEYLPYMDVAGRRAFYANFLRPESNPLHLEYLKEALNDKSVQVKELGVERLSKCKLSVQDLSALAGALRSKSSSFRKSILSVFHQQKSEMLVPVIAQMLESSEQYQIQAAAELLLELKEEHPEIVDSQREALAALREKKLSTQTEILLNQLVAGKEELNYSEENGFGLYDPALTALPKEPVQETKGFIGKLFTKKNDGLFTKRELCALLPPWNEVRRILGRMNEVFIQHRDYEYEVMGWDGSCRKVLFGDSNYGIMIPAKFGSPKEVNGNRRLYMVPFYEEFVKAMGEYARDIKKMLGFSYLASRYNGDHIRNDYEIDDWFAPFAKQSFFQSYHKDSYEAYKQRYWQMMDIVALVYQNFDPKEVFGLSLKIYQSFIALIGEENLGRNYLKKKKEVRNNVYYYGGEPRNYPINEQFLWFWRQMMKKCCQDAEDFKVRFQTEYRIEKMTGVGVRDGLSMADYFRACDMGLVPKDVLYERMLLSTTAQNDISMLTNPTRYAVGKQILEAYPWAREFTDRLVHRIVEVEQQRGELATVLTPVARGIYRFEGAHYFCNLLAALGKENFFRGYEYSGDTTKRAVLSRLLKRCYPAKEDTPEILKGLLAQTDIKEKRLAEAVMYAPQWAGFAEEILGWPGLRSGVWFFHAHVNENFSAEKETEVAIYSPITPQQFNDGAFDKEWFFDAYEKLGEKRFQILYKSAKYITAGSNQHRRSQLYTDAVLGKLNPEELKAEIIEKRNQEKLRCYPLIPLDENHPEEALRRYEFIQKFLKESKQFGAQRRESEKKACNTAMENLAITTGFMDVNRMMWYLESEKLEEIKPLTEPREVEGVFLWMEIDEDGCAELAVEKNGKRQKTLPKSLNKNAYVLELKATIKELKEQQRRARESMERAMTESTAFGTAELLKISENPVLSPLLFKLVWTDGEHHGFLRNEKGTLKLQGVNKDELTLTEGALRIAHPHDLRITGEWPAYMREVYERKLKQPFKQVFREYYPLTEEERSEKTISRRYAGHQVQPQKTVALLKGKGWTVDYEEGLQKVFYKEDLIVRMYALADWFSPADIEAPTLETVEFFDRRTGKNVALSEVPPILFSEVMRDLDLVVSVAHVGGVDPEASHSTVEMRIAIAAELLRILKVQNVEIIGSHAKIRGTLSNYSVHMGSGVVHGEAVGMIAILPVHSQARGRIFLPFADDDPKTAEVMSKILMLADDKKIKDPSILRQITG